VYIVTTKKPQLERVYATLTDPQTRKSKHFTVYGATVDDIYHRVLDAANQTVEVPTMASTRRKPLRPHG